MFEVFKDYDKWVWVCVALLIVQLVMVVVLTFGR